MHILVPVSNISKYAPNNYRYPNNKIDLLCILQTDHGQHNQCFIHLNLTQKDQDQPISTFFYF